MTKLHPDPPYVKPVPHPENRFMALTSNCNDMPTLFVDTQAPLDVLYDAASYRIQRHPSAEKPIHARHDRVRVVHPQRLCLALCHSVARWL